VNQSWDLDALLNIARDYYHSTEETKTLEIKEIRQKKNGDTIVIVFVSRLDKVIDFVRGLVIIDKI